MVATVHVLCQAVILDIAEILQNMIQEERMHQRTLLAQQQ
jgi:hypothetical protein